MWRGFETADGDERASFSLTLKASELQEITILLNRI